ncbi:MAG: FG-GAP repeat domain-containing protein [Terriglobia bacterium]
MLPLLLAVTAGCLLVMVGGGYLLSRHFMTAVPDTVREPRVLKGEGIMQKAALYEDWAVGLITDIHYQEQPPEEPEFVVVGESGAAFLSLDFQRRRLVRFPRFEMDRPVLVDLEGDGTSEFLSRGSWVSKVILFDSDGKPRWTYESPVGVDDAAAGDVDGDGQAEIAVGFNGDGGVHLLDMNGQKLWDEPDGNVWHVEIADVDGDGRGEILHSNARGHLRIRDATGSVVREYDLEPYLADFSLTRWGEDLEPKHLVTTDDQTIYVIDFEGNIVAELEAPESIDTADVYGTSVRFRESVRYYAALLSYTYMRRSILYLYDPEGQLFYHELLDAGCAALLALPSGRAESLLVGCEGKVWRYSLSPNQSPPR